MLAVPDIRIHRDSQAWAEAAAEFVLEVGKEAVRANGRFFIALSGGTTPETLYRALTSPAFADRFDWSRTTFFFSDERCVPPDDPRSNYALAKNTLFTPLKIMPSQVYRMAGESSDPQAAAHEYEQQLRLATKTSPPTQPSLDLILLGLGEDGHTASLFPGDPMIGISRGLVRHVLAPKPPPHRITLTLDVLHAARAAILLATGEGKARAVEAVLRGPDVAVPASLLPPATTTMIVDEAAGARLRN